MIRCKTLSFVSCCALLTPMFTCIADAADVTPLGAGVPGIESAVALYEKGAMMQLIADGPGASLPYAGKIVIYNSAGTPSATLPFQKPELGSLGLVVSMDRVKLDPSGVFGVNILWQNSQSQPELFLRLTRADGSTVDFPLHAGYRFDSHRELFTSWWLQDKSARGTVLLFNSGENASNVTVDIPSSSGSSTALHLILPAKASTTVPLSSLINDKEASSGTLRIQYTGSIHTVYPQLLLTSPGSAFVLSTKFNGVSDAPPSAGRGVWAFPEVLLATSSPSRTTRTFALISNGTENELNLVCSVYAGNAREVERSVIPAPRLKGYETAILDLTQLRGMLVSNPKRIGLTIEHSGSPGSLTATIFTVNDSNSVVYTASGFLLPDTVVDNETTYFDSSAGYVVRHALKPSPGDTTRAVLYYQKSASIGAYSRDVNRSSTGDVEVWNLGQLFNHWASDSLHQVLPDGVDSGLVVLATRSQSAIPVTETLHAECLSCNKEISPSVAAQTNDQPSFTAAPTSDVKPLCSSGSCHVPINFTSTQASADNVNGILYVNYVWASSSGVKSDIGSCRVSELVEYPGTAASYTFPSPPYPAGNVQHNPTLEPPGGIPGSDERAEDVHATSGTFVRPYSNANDNFTATQYYRYSCPCVSGGAYQNLMGPISIVRSVHTIGGRPALPGGHWQFSITKVALQATKDLGAGTISNVTNQ